MKVKNKSAKGARMEVLCLKELTDYVKELPYVKQVLGTWHTYRSRAGGNDLFDGWDCALLEESLTKQRIIWLVQVKSIYSTKEIERLSKLSIGNHCFLAVYNEPRFYSIKLPHFWLIPMR